MKQIILDITFLVIFSTFLVHFSKDNMYDNVWEWAKIYKAKFWDDEAIHFKQLTSFSPLPK